MNDKAPGNPFANFVTISANPVLMICDDFITKDECKELIKMGQFELDQSKVGPGARRDEIRNSDTAFLPYPDGALQTRLRDRVCELVHLPPLHAEHLQILRYTEGEYYKPHFDAGDRPTVQTNDGTQRFFTMLIYLNEGFEGGTTTFPRLNAKISAKRGRAVLWSNTILGDMRPHPLSLHSGDTVTKGEKWAATFWLRRPALIDKKADI